MNKFIKFCIINVLFMQLDFRRTSVWNFWIRRNGIDFSETDPKSDGFRIGIKIDASAPIRWPPYTSSSFDLFVLFLFSGKTDHETSISKNFDFLKKSCNGNFNSFHTSSSFDLFALLPLSEETDHWIFIKNLFEIFMNH